MKSAYTTAVALALALIMGFAPIANADRGQGHRGQGWHHGSKIIHVHARHGHHGHRGHWHHGHHRSHFGWWWVVGPAWYYYPRVVHPHYREQPPVVSGPPPTQYWYFCESSQTYYPYVSSCAEGWKPVPATPQ